MKTWSEMKQAVDFQLSRDPQRATLSLRAIASVEEGLRHLASVGYSFEPRNGALPAEPSALTRTLSIAEAVGHVRPGVVETGGSEVFNAE